MISERHLAQLSKFVDSQRCVRVHRVLLAGDDLEIVRDLCECGLVERLRRRGRTPDRFALTEAGVRAGNGVSLLIAEGEYGEQGFSRPSRGMHPVLKKKAFCPVTRSLEGYLERFGRQFDIPLAYDELRGFAQAFPHFDREGNDTLWKTVTYEPYVLKELNAKLATIYALLKTGDIRVVDHLFVARVDFCEFGNSQPFRIRIVNQVDFVHVDHD